MAKNRTRPFASQLVVLVAILTTVGSAQSSRPNDIKITVLSSRSDMVSGGDALIEVALPPGTATPRVSINGRDVTAAFESSGASRVLVGLVDGLRVGKNVLAVAAGDATGQISLTNYPIAGPILSGPHMTPFICTTQESGLGAPLDDDCSAPTKFDYYYRSRGFGGAELKPLPPETMPNDIAETTTRDGQKVPYIVRLESGTINRSIYRIAILDTPSQSASTGRWKPGPAWNGRLVGTFGGGCGTSYNQGRNNPQAVLSDLFLSRGFAVMTSTLNVLGLQCNDALSAETFMMLKEHFIEQYGVPAWTVGSGGSGGAILQLLLAQNFPGLLDGLMPARSFPDVITLWSAHADCRLLETYVNANGWSPDKRQAVEGLSHGTCPSAAPYVDTIVATKGCDIPGELTYDPQTNLKGARCTIWDTNVNTFGRDPSTGFARRTYDNIGVQYGLQALNRGAISKTEFIDLNARVGGYDNDGNMRAQRTTADAEAVRLAYVTGRINTGGGALGSVPIISFRAYLDDVADVHDRIRDMIIRLRLQEGNGRSDNYVSWLAPNGPLLAVEEELALDTISVWLDNLGKDTSKDTAIVKVVRAKPARAVDACWDRDATRIDEPFTFDSPTSKCNKVFPIHSTPRLEAGETRSLEIVKCQLKALTRAEYKVAFTDAEWQQLTQAFPTGVCDYAKPGVNAGPIVGTYLSLPLAAASPQRSQSGVH